MMRLAADKEFREAILTFKAEAAKAGVNMDDPVRCQSDILWLYDLYFFT